MACWERWDMDNSNSSGAGRYEFSGIKHVRNDRDSGTTTWDEFAIFQIIKELEKHGHWAEERDLCEEQIRKTPEWLAPYLCAGVAYANLGYCDQAIRRLEHVERMAASNPEYSAATRVLNQLRQEHARSSGFFN
jgi:hypothetical protein